MPLWSPLTSQMVGLQQHDRAMERIKRLGLTERQLELNRYWSHYCTTQYEHRNVDWDGRKRLSPIEKETLSRQTALPMGFVDKGGQYEDIPLAMRRPTAPYHLVRVVVHRFTGLLFSDKKHPHANVPDNPSLQAWIDRLIKVTRLWIRFAVARNYGGGQGSVAMSFRFRNGRPIVDVHDARWCIPKFSDQSTGELQALEIRYMYPVEERDKDGKPVQVWYWYRRIIDQQQDVVFRAAPVGEGDEPFWAPETVAQHGFGECPAVWIRNTPTDDIDGEPDCLGLFDTQEAMDRLISQADQGAVENADPTLEVDSDELKQEQLKKGSRNAIKLEKGGSAKYVEMSGSGIDSALKVADVHRRNFLEVAQCILETEESQGAMTATEIERRYSSMHERGAVFREQYGEHGVKPLLAKMIRAVDHLRRSPGLPDPVTGLRVVQEVIIPGAEFPIGLSNLTDDTIDLMWPEWVERGPTDAQAAAQAVATARSAQVMDLESAFRYIAPFFGIDDIPGALARIKSEAGAGDQQMMGGLQGIGTPRQPGMPSPGAPTGAPPAAPPEPPAPGNQPPEAKPPGLP